MDETASRGPSRWFTEGFVRAHPDRVQVFVGWAKQADPDSYAACCEALGGYDVRSRLASVAAPVQVISATTDPITPPEVGADLAARIPGSRYTVLDGAAHFAVVEAAHQIAPLIDSLIASHLVEGTELSGGAE